jgi:hypothetical protein
MPMSFDAGTKEMKKKTLTDLKYPQFGSVISNQEWRRSSEKLMHHSFLARHEYALELKSVFVAHVKIFGET